MEEVILLPNIDMDFENGTWLKLLPKEGVFPIPKSSIKKSKEQKVNEIQQKESQNE